MNKVSKHQALRLSLFLIIASFIVFGPFLRQIINPGWLYFPRWVMFRGIGKNLLDVRFFRILPNGDSVEINRFETLNQIQPSRAPKWLKRIRGMRGLRRVVKSICKKIGPQADLRANIRIAKHGGWTHSEMGKSNLCKK